MNAPQPITEQDVPIINTEPALTPLHLTPRCYVNGSHRRAYLVDLYRTAAAPLAVAWEPQP